MPAKPAPSPRPAPSRIVDPTTEQPIVPTPTIPTPTVPAALTTLPGVALIMAGAIAVCMVVLAGGAVYADVATGKVPSGVLELLLPLLALAATLLGGHLVFGSTQS